MPIIRNGPFKVYVLYLDEKIELKEQFDLIEHTQSLTKKLNVKNEQFFSINILLEQNLDTIFSKFKKDTRNEIRRVENKELLDCLILQNMEEQELEYLFLSYSYFSKLKNIGNLNINRLKQLIALNKIFISSIYNNKIKLYYIIFTILLILH